MIFMAVDASGLAKRYSGWLDKRIQLSASRIMQAGGRVKMPNISLECFDSSVKVEYGRLSRIFLISFGPDNELYRGGQLPDRLPEERSRLGVSVLAVAIPESATPDFVHGLREHFSHMDPRRLAAHRKTFGESRKFFDVRYAREIYQGQEYSGVQVASPIVPVLKHEKRIRLIFERINADFFAPIQAFSSRYYE